MILDHIEIFAQIIALISGAIVSFYYLQKWKLLKDRLSLFSFFYTTSMTLVILGLLFFQYSSTNLLQVRKDYSSLFQFLFFIFSYAFFYSFMHLAFTTVKKDIKPSWNYILIAGIFILALFHIPGKGIIEFKIGRLHFSEIKLITYFLILVMIGTSILLFHINRTGNNSGKRIINIYFLFLIPGLALYLISWLLGFISTLFTTSLQLFLVLFPFFWFRKYYLNNKIFLWQSNLNVIDLISTKYSLTAREKEILALLVEGKNNKEIEGILFISLSTIRNHISSLYGKIGINSRGQLMNLILKTKPGE